MIYNFLNTSNEVEIGDRAFVNGSFYTYVGTGWTLEAAQSGPDHTSEFYDGTNLFLTQVGGVVKSNIFYFHPANLNAFRVEANLSFSDHNIVNSDHNGIGFYNDLDIQAFELHENGIWRGLDSVKIVYTGTSDHTIVYTDRMIVCNNGSNNINIIFPHPGNDPVVDNTPFTIRRSKDGLSTGTVTLTTPSGQFEIPATGLLDVNHVTTLADTGTAGSRVTYVSDGTDWILQFA